MEDRAHPRVVFVHERMSEGRPPLGYLFIVDGECWVAKSLDDARHRVPAVSAPLDPKLLACPFEDGGIFEYLDRVVNLQGLGTVD